MRDTIELAREAGARLDKHNGGFIDQSVLLRFAALVRADEREAMCDIVDYELDSNGHAEAIKIAIQARGETK